MGGSYEGSFCGAYTSKGEWYFLEINVRGPAPLEGNDPGDVWFATCVDGVAEAHFLKMPFDRERIRQFTCIMTLNSVRNRLLAEG